MRSVICILRVMFNTELFLNWVVKSCRKQKEIFKLGTDRQIGSRTCNVASSYKCFRKVILSQNTGNWTREVSNFWKNTLNPFLNSDSFGIIKSKLHAPCNLNAGNATILTFSNKSSYALGDKVTQSLQRAIKLGPLRWQKVSSLSLTILNTCSVFAS